MGTCRLHRGLHLYSLSDVRRSHVWVIVEDVICIQICTASCHSRIIFCCSVWVLSGMCMPINGSIGHALEYRHDAGQGGVCTDCSSLVILE